MTSEDYSRYYFCDYRPDTDDLEHDAQNRVFEYADKDKKEILFEIITYSRLLEIAEETLDYNLSEAYEDARASEESEGLLMCCQGELKLFQEWAIDDYGMRCGWESETITLDDESKATFVIDEAKRNNYAWYSLSMAINFRLMRGMSLARPYIEFIHDVMLDQFEIPTSPPRPHTLITRRAYMKTAQDLADRFNLKITKNDASEHPFSTLGIVAKLTGLSYGTLKKEVYQRHRKGEL